MSNAGTRVRVSNAGRVKQKHSGVLGLARIADPRVTIKQDHHAKVRATELPLASTAERRTEAL